MLKCLEDVAIRDVHRCSSMFLSFSTSCQVNIATTQDIFYLQVGRMSSFDAAIFQSLAFLHLSPFICKTVGKMIKTYQNDWIDSLTQGLRSLSEPSSVSTWPGSWNWSTVPMWRTGPLIDHEPLGSVGVFANLGYEPNIGNDPVNILDHFSHIWFERQLCKPFLEKVAFWISLICLKELKRRNNQAPQK